MNLNNTSMLSVCVASYNGEKFIVEQLTSILTQLGENDEIVIVDDCSTDATLELIEGISDRRIKVYRHEKNTGHVQAFAHAIEKCSGDYVFLSDQDDVWLENKLSLFLERFAISGVECVVSNYYSWNPERGSKSVRHTMLTERQSRFGRLLLLFQGRVGHLGCCMAFSKELISKAVPFPNSVDAHDRWLLLYSIIFGEIGLVEEYTLLHRKHSKNVTPKQRRKISVVVHSRLMMFLHLLIAVKRFKWN